MCRWTLKLLNEKHKYQYIKLQYQHHLLRKFTNVNMGLHQLKYTKVMNDIHQNVTVIKPIKINDKTGGLMDLVAYGACDPYLHLAIVGNEKRYKKTIRNYVNRLDKFISNEPIKVPVMKTKIKNVLAYRYVDVL